ncbi:MAG: phage tail family protein [Elusimicrobiaceae bacterium]|nr:phage tail family protein [Elusimicrobiaceae bacterium]
MLQVIAENKYNEQINLTQNGNYALLSVGGLTPPAATINTAVIATSDGAVFNSSRLGTRNIVLTIAPLNSIEKNRINIYKYFKAKQYIKLYLENNTRSVWIEGYIDNIDGDLFSQSQRLQISIICPDPYFKDTTTGLYTFSNVINLFSFPFAIEETPGIPVSQLGEFVEIAITNNSDDETGVLITMLANAAVTNPTIYNMTTNEHFTLDIDLEAGDVITIDTRRGHKTVTLNHNGVITNILNNMVQGSAWLNLVVGDNIFSYTCDTGSEYLNISVQLQPIYEGV